MKTTAPAANLLESAQPGTNAHRSNGFDLIRLVAAITVIYGHAYYIAGFGDDVPSFLGNELATIAVKVFLVTSGFLVTQSWMADPRLHAFAVRRALRIMPALICTILLTILVLGSIFTTFTVGAYIFNGSTWFYLWNIALYPVYGLPGVFGSNPYPAAVNGSLWTIPVEVLMYLTVPVLLWRNSTIFRLGLALATILLAEWGVYLERVATIDPSPVFYGTDLMNALEVAPYFLIGSFCAVFRLQRFSRPVFSVILLIAAAFLIDAYILGELTLMLLLPFAVISVGMQHLPLIDRALARGDYSYGVYLYAFPVQQACEALSGNRMTTLENFGVSLPITFILAVLSWFLIERQALSLKPKRAKKLP